MRGPTQYSNSNAAFLRIAIDPSIIHHSRAEQTIRTKEAPAGTESERLGIEPVIFERQMMFISVGR
jgi:hypothetical protein